MPRTPQKSPRLRNVQLRMQRACVSATIVRFDDGRLGEIFLGNSKAGSHSDAAAKDSAVVTSLALQHGVPLDVIRKALLRHSHGRPSSPLGTALDFIARAAK
jgi:hypothetical protein